MREHVAPFVYFLEVHLLYASILCLAAWGLTSIRAGSATWKYWIWVVTSLNFIVPLGGFFDRFGAATVSWAHQLRGLDAIGVSLAHHPTAGAVLAGAWLCGTTLMLARLLGRIRADRRAARADAARAAEPQRGLRAHGVPIRFSASAPAPFVAGILRPNISLPHGIEQLLSGAELDAVLLHEVAHARRRDNLIGLIHEAALCGLWFHPLVWLTAFRLVLYRELSCDERVIEKAHGANLVSALAKLAVPQQPSLLQARAGSYLGVRLTRLVDGQSPEPCVAANTLLAVLFAALLFACVLGTIAHTAHCFVVRT